MFCQRSSARNVLCCICNSATPPLNLAMSSLTARARPLMAVSKCCEVPCVAESLHLICSQRQIECCFMSSQGREKLLNIFAAEGPLQRPPPKLLHLTLSLPRL